MKRVLRLQFWVSICFGHRVEPAVSRRANIECLVNTCHVPMKCIEQTGTATVHCAMSMVLTSGVLSRSLRVNPFSTMSCLAWNDVGTHVTCSFSSFTLSATFSEYMKRDDKIIIICLNKNIYITQILIQKDSQGTYKVMSTLTIAKLPQGTGSIQGITFYQ